MRYVTASAVTTGTVDLLIMTFLAVDVLRDAICDAHYILKVWAVIVARRCPYANEQEIAALHRGSRIISKTKQSTLHFPNDHLAKAGLKKGHFTPH